MTKSRYLVVSAPIILLLSLADLGCGSDEAACTDTVCACNEGGIRFAIEQGDGPYTFECEGRTTVTTGDVIVIVQDVVLDGGGNLVLDGGGNHRVLEVEEGVSAELIGFEVTGGRDSLGEVGGILNAGTLTLTDSVLSMNAEGALRNAETATAIVSNCTFSDNSDPTGGAGGIFNAGTLTLTDSTLSMNAQGALNNSATGTATVSNCTFSENPDRGIINAFGATLTLTDTTVTENRSGRGDEETERFGKGGGIWTDGTLVASGTTISDNTAQEGGGIYNSGRLTLINSTVSGNTGEDLGGGIHTDDSTDGVTLINTTVVENSSAEGSAIWSDATPPVSLTNTILQGSCGGPGEYVSNGYNIESPENTCGLSQSTDQVDVSTQALGLGRLGDNGGPTETHALGAGSVAVDEIPTSDCLDAEGNPLTVDQRGEPRPSGTMCDVGAFEL
jgi:hypothetical protein